MAKVKIGRTQVEYAARSYDINTVEFKRGNPLRYFLAPLKIIDLAVDSEAQPRAYDENNARRLADSIRQKTLMQPILVRYDSEKDALLIIEGQHRWRALKDFLKIDWIPAIVYIDMQVTLATQCGLEANAEDRARALTGGDFAKKVFSLLDIKRQEMALEKKMPPEHIYEFSLFSNLGWENKSKIRSGIIAYTVESVRRSEASKIRLFIADRQTKSLPLTAKNFGFFLKHIVRLKPADAEGGCRLAELENIIKITNLFAEMILINKWNPKTASPEGKKAHEHAKHLCSRFPFEVCGYFLAKILSRRGGMDQMVGAAYVPTNTIDWNGVKNDMEQLLDGTFWDDTDVFTLRNIEDLIREVDSRNKQNASRVPQ
jgi:hypothetical protein